MITIGHLYKLSFDNMENRNALIREKVKTFLPKDSKTAYGVCSDWMFNNLKAECHYLGWDNKVYPQYIYEEEQVG